MGNESQHKNSVVLAHLGPLRGLLDDPTITDICINGYGSNAVVWINKGTGWLSVPCEGIDDLWARALPLAVGSMNQRHIGHENTLFSGELPDGERIEIVLPPNCEQGTIALAIRKHSTTFLTLNDLDENDLLSMVAPEVGELQDFELKLLALKKEGRYREFLEYAVETERTMILSGATGTGKTTLQRALTALMPPRLRIITLETVRELTLPNHRNHVHLLYDDKETTEGAIGPEDLLRSILRLIPDRIILAEIRGPEAWEFVSHAVSGHVGSIATLHAGTIAEAFDRLLMCIYENKKSRNIPPYLLSRMLRRQIDVIIQFVTVWENGKLMRRIRDIYYNPQYKYDLRLSEGEQQLFGEAGILR